MHQQATYISQSPISHKLKSFHCYLNLQEMGCLQYSPTLLISMEIPNYPYLKILTFFMFIFTINSATDPISEAIFSLKSELIDTSNTLNDWVLPLEDEDPSQKIQACSWSGVKCDKNSTKVIGLDLSMKNLGGTLSGQQFSFLTDLLDLNVSHNSFSGKLPVGIFNLSNLTSMDISRNNFSGTFPSGISNLTQLLVLDAFSNSFSGSLPTDVSAISSLKVLNFAGSYFNGSIPSQYGSLQNLEFIHLAGNFLTGSLPPELGMLKKVTHMEIGYNSYQGNIPWQFGNMSELQYLDIAGANLSGSIPTQLSNLTNLHTLFLFRNQLSGLIPSDFSNISPLTSLDLSDNLLTGPIPESFSALKNLSLLSLFYNDMSGPVPEGIVKLPNLDTLLIWNNFFSGSLSQDLGKHSKLKWVDVSTNSFIGVIPPDICSGGVLFKLILFSNNFSGDLSPLSNCSTLVRLRMEDNSFSGEIPLSFRNLHAISYVDMSRNRLIGGIPLDIFQAPNLQYFNVSNNLNLGGIIPEKTWSLPAIQNFSAFSCNISGSIPQFHACKSLSVLELQKNQLSGTFPESVSKCKSLEKINLAENHLTGQILMKLGNSTILKYLNVSFNDFWGPIPSEKIFRAMDSSSFLGNPKLCGAPLRPCHHGKGIAEEVEWGSRRTQKLAWVLILCAVAVLLITVSVFAIFYYRRRKGQWKMVSFSGLPQFTANDVLRSLDSNAAIEMEPVPSQQPSSVCKAVLPTGITVLVKKIEWETKRMNDMREFLNQIGHARHKNLIRLLGFCCNKDIAYLLYENLPNGNLSERIGMKRDWASKCRIFLGVARGLCFLHHDCCPAIPHGDLKASNIVFDENMEPHLAEYGLKSLARLNNGWFASTMSRMESGECNSSMEEELYGDIHNFGRLVLEILTNGRLKNIGGAIESESKEVLLREIYDENEGASSSSSSNSLQEEIKVVLEVVLCTTSRNSDRPSMKDVLKLLSGLRPQGK